MSTKPVTLALTAERHGPFLILSQLTKLLGHLRVARVEPAVEDCTGLVRKDVALFGFTDPFFGRKRPGVWAGLEPALRGLLKAHDLALDVLPPPGDDTASGGNSANGALAPEPSATVTPDPAGAAAPPADPVVSFAAACRGGWCAYGSGVAVLGMIAELCVAFTNKQVIVLVRTRAAARRLRALLRALGVEAAVITGEHYDDPRRVTVSTLGVTGRAGIERADVLLIEDALHSTWIDPLIEPRIPHEMFFRGYVPNSTERDPAHAPTVGLMDRLPRTKTSAIVIGFLPHGRSLSPFEQAHAWQIYGFAELVVPRHGTVERPVVTSDASQVNLRRSIPTGADELDVKKAIWHDGLRCRLRAKLARALTAGGETPLRLAFSTLAAALPDFAPGRYSSCARGSTRRRRFARSCPPGR